MTASSAWGDGTKGEIHEENTSRDWRNGSNVDRNQTGQTDKKQGK